MNDIEISRNQIAAGAQERVKKGKKPFRIYVPLFLCPYEPEWLHLNYDYVKQIM